MKYVTAFERYFDEEDKNKTLVYHYKNGEITPKGELTIADEFDKQTDFINTVVSVLPKLISDTSNIELAYIPISNEMIVKFNVGEEERCFVMKNVFSGFLLYSSVQIPVMDVLTRVREWHTEIETYDDYPYAYYIPGELASWTKFILNHPELKDIANHPCLLLR